MKYNEINDDGQVSVTRKNQHAADADRLNGITDLEEAGSIVAIAGADDACYDYYLLKVTSSGAVSFEHDTIDNYGAAYQKGTLLERSFFLRDNIIDITYKLDKKAIVHANTVQAVCGEFVLIRRRKELYKCSPAQHEEIMSVYFVIFLFNETC